MTDTSTQTETRHTFDVSAQRVAKVYAESLLDAAEEKGQTDSVLDELGSLVDDVFAKQPDLESLITGGAIGREHKEHVIRSAFEGRASESFFNFLLVLNDHERLDLLRPILQAARDLNDVRRKRVRVQVQSAVPLDDDQRRRLEETLQATFRWKPILETQVVPELLGGLVVRFRDWLFDGSVSTQLENLRHQLIESSSHEIQVGRGRFSSDEA